MCRPPPSVRLLLPALALCLAAPPAAAQLAVGGQVGTPTGLSLKLGAGRGAVALAAGWDFDDAVEVEGHYLLRDRQRVGSSGRVGLFYGPGAFVRAGNDDTDAGISLAVGLSAFLTREIELYGLLSPRLQLVDDTDVDLGAGLGLRLTL